MPKIIITYDADNGVVSGDAHAERIVDVFLAEASNVAYSTANASVVDAMRVAVAEKRIAPEEVVFVFEGESIFVNATGELDKWPRGFCDHVGNRLAKMMAIRRSKS